MKEKVTLEGRSLLFNIIFVVLNLAGLSMLVLAYHESTQDHATLFKMLGWMMMMLSIGGLIIFKGKLMMSSVARVLVGGLFIVSGLVKANDPIGFAYKLEEYFEDGALAYRVKELLGLPGFSLEYFMDWALVLSVIICIAEIVLGVLTIIGGKMKIVSYLMMIMMIFFTFLTWHTSSCDPDAKFLDHDTYAMSDPGDASTAKIKLKRAKEIEAEAKAAKKAGKEYSKELWVVSKSKEEVVIAEMKTPQCVADCGCFGDALKGSVGRSLTPAESLWKDIVLLYLVFWIFLAQRIVKPNTRKENIFMGVASMGVVVFFSWVFGWYFPIFFAAISLIGALWILRIGKRILGNHYGSALIVTVLCGILVTYVLLYVPIKDYRPYAVGSNLIEKMNNGVDGEYESVFVYKNSKTGKVREMTQKEYMASNIWEDSTWVFESRDQRTIVEAVNPSIMDFNPTVSVNNLSEDERNSILVQNILAKSQVQSLKLYDELNKVEEELPIEEYDTAYYPADQYSVLDTITTLDPNLSDIEIVGEILAQDKIVMVISRNLSEGSWKNIDRLKAIKAACDKKNVPFIVICNASHDEIVAFKKKYDFHVPIFSMDEIELKIISRSNPALMVLEKAVVKAKYAHRSTPDVESFKSKHLN